MPGMDDLAETERRAWEIVEGAPASDAVRAMCDALGGLTATASLFDPEGGQGIDDGFAYVDPALVELLNREFGTPDTNPVLASMRRMPLGRFAHNAEMIDLDAVRRTAFYADWWVPTGVGDDAGGILLPSPDGRLVWVVMGLLRGRDWFDPQERRFAEAAAGGIARALRTTARLAHERAGAAVDAAAPDPCWLLGADGAVLLCNRAAAAPPPGALPLQRRNGHLAPSDPAAETRFRAIVGDVLRGASGGGAVAVRAREGHARLAVEPGPTYRDRRSALVTLVPARPMAWTVDDLARAYGLTPREAEVALLLAGGASSRAIARRLGISAESVRLYLKRAFGKTHTHGQAELVSLVLHGRRTGR